jgi:hypothetical protein
VFEEAIIFALLPPQVKKEDELIQAIHRRRKGIEHTQRAGRKPRHSSNTSDESTTIKFLILIVLFLVLYIYFK